MQEILNRAPRLLALMLVLAAFTVTGWQLYQFWEAIQAPRAPVTAGQAAVERTGERPDIDFAAINFFGVADGDGEPVEVDTENLPETNLRLVLRGVSASDYKQEDRRKASALVEGPDRQTDYYLVGSELPGSAALKAVYPDRIVIERQGNLENLYFPEEFETASFEAQDARTSAGDQSDNTSVQNSGSQPAAGAGDARKEEIRARLERLRERLRSNN